MKSNLAFVLGGGGARGAMQVGALRALAEAGFRPDLLVGTSIGAVNAAALGLWGVDLDGIDRLERTYGEIAAANLLDPQLARLTLRLLSGRPDYRARRRAEEILISKGVTPDFRFEQITNVRLALIGADLTMGQPVIYGQDPRHSVLEGVLASMAVPPWFAPIMKDDHLIVDGGVMSNLPIEPALRMGATEIIALDLNDPAALSGNASDLSQYMPQLIFSIIHRQTCLELALAEAQGVTVRRIELRSSPPVPLWDFSTYQELAQTGYEIAARAIADWDRMAQPKLLCPIPLRRWLASVHAPVAAS